MRRRLLRLERGVREPLMIARRVGRLPKPVSTRMAAVTAMSATARSHRRDQATAEASQEQDGRDSYGYRQGPQPGRRGRPRRSDQPDAVADRSGHDQAGRPIIDAWPPVDSRLRDSHRPAIPAPRIAAIGGESAGGVVGVHDEHVREDRDHRDQPSGPQDEVTPSAGEESAYADGQGRRAAASRYRAQYHLARACSTRVDGPLSTSGLRWIPPRNSWKAGCWPLRPKPS